MYVAKYAFIRAYNATTYNVFDSARKTQKAINFHACITTFRPGSSNLLTASSCCSSPENYRCNLSCLVLKRPKRQQCFGLFGKWPLSPLPPTHSHSVFSPLLPVLQVFSLPRPENSIQVLSIVQLNCILESMSYVNAENTPFFFLLHFRHSSLNLPCFSRHPPPPIPPATDLDKPSYISYLVEAWISVMALYNLFLIW